METYGHFTFKTETNKISAIDTASRTGFIIDPVAFAYDFGARMYDARLGIFTSVDPKANKLPGWSPYTAFADNPILHIDDDGKWPTAAHNKMIDEAFGKKSAINLTDAQIVALKQGSANADAMKNQTGAKQYIHGMLPSGENPATGQKWTKEEAIAATDKFIEDKVNAFVQTGDFEQLGEALHPLMDVTSPTHRDEKGNPVEFDWFSGHSHKEDPDRITKNDGKKGYITEKDMKKRFDKAENAMQNKYKDAIKKREDFLKKQEAKAEY